METDLLVGHHEYSHHNREKEFSVMLTVNNRFQEAPDYRTYHLADRSSHYDDKVTSIVAIGAKHLQVQMRSQVFHSFDPLSSFSVQSTF